MTLNLVYCYLAELTTSFKPLTEADEIHLRFINSLKLVQSSNIKLKIIIINGMEHDLSKNFKNKLPVGTECITYSGGGFDVGAYKHAASNLDPNLPHVFFNTQSYIKDGPYIERLISVASEHGPGVYGSMASFESNAHLRTCCITTYPKTLLQYPLTPRSYSDACDFEHGTNNFSLWCNSNGLPAFLVTIDRVLPLNQWRTLSNGFRNGNQSACLVYDKHTLIYENSPDTQRLILRMQADGLIGH